MSRVVPRTKLSERLRETLGLQSFPTLASSTTQRVAYAEATQSGQTVFDGKVTTPPRWEIEAIRDEIREMINVN